MPARPRTFALLVGLLAIGGGCDEPEIAPSPAPPPEAPASEAPSPEAAEAPADAPTEGRAGEERAPALTLAEARQVRDHLRRARRANRAGDRETAIESYRAASAIAPDGRALCELGWVQFQSGDLEAARESIERALVLLPSRQPLPDFYVGPVGACYYNMGRLQEEEGQPERARASYARSLELRPGNRVVQARLDALPSAGAEATASPAPMPRCGEGTRAFDPAAWAARVGALEGPRSAFVAPLAEAGIAVADASRFVDTMAQGPGDDAPLVATVRRLPLQGTSAVALHAKLEDEMGGQFDGVSVLRIADGEACLLGALGEAVGTCSTGCLSDAPTFALRTEALVAEGREALRVATHTGECGCGSSRGSQQRLRFLGVEGDALATYFEATTYEAWYESPWPPTAESFTEVTLGEGFPRPITVVARTTCDPCGVSLRAQLETAEDDEARVALEDQLFDECGGRGQESCTPSERTTTLVYRDGAYAER